MYHIVIRNPIQFGLIVDYLSVGLSFREVAKVILMTKEETGMTSIGSVSEGKVTAIAWVVCYHSLELISNLLMKCWTFSLAMDMSTHMSTSYLDIQIWFFYSGTIQNFHLVAVSLFTCYTGEQIYLHAKKILDILCPEWQSIMLSITTDGENSMTGHIQWVATRFEQAALPGFFRIWCGLYQLHLVLQLFYTELMNKSFYGILTNLISYLQWEFNLIAEMKTKAKIIADTEWESMSKVSNWFKVHQVQLLQYLEEKNPICKPPHKMVAHNPFYCWHFNLCHSHLLLFWRIDYITFCSAPRPDLSSI